VDRAHWDRRPPFRHDVFVEMYLDEQAARAKREAEDWRTHEVVELRRRVAQLEKILGPRGRRLAGDLIAGIGEALGKIRVQDRERLLGEIDSRGYCRYVGTWDEGADYNRGAMVTCAGSTWIATGPCAKGVRPGRAAEWRLAVKGGEASKGPVTV
jgi:hypothetical protein